MEAACKTHHWIHVANRPTGIPGPDANKTMTVEWCQECGCLAIGTLIGPKDGRDICAPNICSHSDRFIKIPQNLEPIKALDIPLNKM